MRLIGRHHGRDYFLHAMQPGDDLPDPFGGTPYPALVWATVPTADGDRRRITEALVATQCRYAICGGVECRLWHDAVDDAFLDQDLPPDESEKRFVLTTWHTNESEDDVAFFFSEADFDDHCFTRYLVLLIGPDDETEKRLATSVAAHARRAYRRT